MNVKCEERQGKKGKVGKGGTDFFLGTHVMLLLSGTFFLSLWRDLGVSNNLRRPNLPKAF